ncbi:extracellular solute-binding protein [Paenibacillus eucommiae]|uniref:Aldouronate transport system substrate-binding protein n=1 Tax=Paenibacillus eucommiae TaxID=1355755 RepID=A0ABS4ILX0_9BACL|nr:extracellular solute-binding protein [Paenibacillus eucommiae]MBP1988568.1 putative aldouronate transport system substrate-binding protein [Paenibacillus eucommiae]
MTRRTPIIRLSVFMLAMFILLAGCSTAKNPGDNASSSPGSSTKPTAGQSAEPAEISIFTIDSPYVKKNYDQDLPVFKEIEKNLNVKLKWQLMPSAGFEDALKIKLSAGADMPDIFATWQQSPEELGKNGAVVALSDYFDTTMPNTKKAIESNPVLKAAVTSPDGKVYFLPSVNQPPKMGWLIRQDWLDTLNLKVPETMDEFYEVLKAFRDLDPNGNKKKDEVPAAFNYVNYVWFYLMHAYGINTAQPWDYLGQDENGQFYTYLTRPEFKETMAFASKLYTEKLMNQDILNVSAEGYQKLITDNRTGVIFDALGPDYLNKIKEANPGLDAKWTVMLPLKGPRGDRGMRSYSGLDGEFFVSKNSKNVEAATRFIDYIFADPEGSSLVNWGIKGMSYEEEGGVKQSTDFVLNNPEGLTPSDVLLSLGVQPVLPKIIDPSAHEKISEIQLKDHPWITEGIKRYEEAGVIRDPEKRYRFTSEESGQIKDIHTQLETYISETLAKILVGNKPIDEFDSFVKTLNDKGIDKMVEIYQKVDARSK